MLAPSYDITLGALWGGDEPWVGGGAGAGGGGDAGFKRNDGADANHTAHIIAIEMAPRIQKESKYTSIRVTIIR